jgi:hypothetical protein
MNDKEAAEFYSNPDALRPGRRVTPPRRPMSGHVPVRFPESSIEQIKSLAVEDGVTVSSWIRKVVDEAVKRRVGQYTAFAYATRVLSVTFRGTERQARTDTSTRRLADSPPCSQAPLTRL